MARTVKKAGAPVRSQRRRTMHGTSAEWKLMTGTGALIKQDASRVKVSGEKPGKGKERP